MPNIYLYPYFLYRLFSKSIDCLRNKGFCGCGVCCLGVCGLDGCCSDDDDDDDDDDEEEDDDEVD